MKLTLVISTLSQGGAERVITSMANYWSANGHEVTVLTLSETSTTPFFNLHPSVKVFGLGVVKPSGNIFRATVNNIKRIISIRREVVQSAPDVLISFMTETNILTIISTYGLSIPVIVSERANPNVYPVSIIWKALRRIVYRASCNIVLQSKASAEYFSHFHDLKCRVIHNPVVAFRKNVSDSTDDSKNEKTVISLGRLVHDKGYDLLLKAFAKTRENHLDWKLVVYGDGPLRKELEKQKDDLGLSNSVEFPGVTSKPTDALQEGDLFVLSSRTEGFPNALCEAMACGLPVISFDCSYGPSEIIRDNVDGLLVPAGDINKLAESMSALMQNEDYRRRLGKEAQKIKDRFGEHEIMGVWDKLLNELI